MTERPGWQRDKEATKNLNKLAMQVSLYPLRQASIGPPVRKAMRVFRQRGLEVRVGEMSTLVCGEEGVLFAALQEAFHQAAESGDAVMVVTLSNACPEREPRVRSRRACPEPEET
jgi:uncharacterized protein YqgV (UPF0045/DUF77 family)